MSSGIEVSIIAKAMSPIVVGLYEGAKGVVKDGFAKWSAENFSNRLAKKLSGMDKIKTIWSPSKEKSLLSIYFPSKVKMHDESFRVVNSICELGDGNLVVEGIVGHGKSMFLRFLCLQELTGKGTGKLPLFVELRTLTDKRDLQVHINEAIEKLDLNGDIDVFDYLSRSGKIVLLLDGFDEIDDSLVGQTIAKIEYLCDKYEMLRIIITSRPTADIQKSRLFKTVNLIGLERDDYSGFLRKLGIGSEKILEIVDVIDRSPADVSSLISTPLMLTLLVMVYESENEIPSELPEFFEKLFTTMFSRHDRLKAGFVRKHYSGLPERKLQNLFEIFCFISIQKKMGRSLSAEQFSNAFDIAEKHFSGGECTLDNFKKDISKVSCLMLEEGYDITTFLHKSIAEYFAASFVWKSSEDFSEKFYSQVKRDFHNWMSSLAFLEKIDSYRFYKYYVIPNIKSLFLAIGLSPGVQVSIETWVRFYMDNNPKLRVVMHRNRVGGADSDKFFPGEYGPFGMDSEWGNEIQHELINTLMLGVDSDISLGLHMEELLAEPLIFSRVEHSDGRITFDISLESMFKRYGTVEFVKRLRIYEEKLQTVLAKGIRVVEEEDGKKSILEDTGKELSIF